jgi:hypothetical protein
MDTLYELKEMLCEELKEYGKKGKLDVGVLEIVDKLAHAIKNIDKIIESYEDEEYSGRMMYDDGISYERNGSYARDSYTRGGNRGGRGGSSYARGRGRNARRDSMGRYSSDNDMLVEELRSLMEDAPDERTKMEFQKFITKMEQM